MSTQYVAIGDSFTAGTDPGVPSFADRFAQRFDSYLNLAAAGSLTADVIEQQLDRAIAAEPVIVSLVVGANDVVRTPRPDLDRCEANFDLMLTRLTAAKPQLILTATYPSVGDFLPLRERTRARMSRGLVRVNEIVRELSAKHGAVCVDLEAHPGRVERSNFADDGFHPSDIGHAKATIAFEEALQDFDQEVAA